MNGLAFNVQGCYPCRGQDGYFFSRSPPEMIKKRRFPRSRFSRNENVMVRFFHNVKGLTELRVDINFTLFAMGFHGAFIFGLHPWLTALPVQ